MLTSSLENPVRPLDREWLTSHLDHGLMTCTLPELGKPYRGKVRDCYIAGGRRILVATDRISAFDRVFAETIPCKGEILNRMSAHFLARASEIVPTHFESLPDGNVTVARELAAYPIEMVVRGYLTGSAWRDYQEGVFAQKYGFALPEGLAPNARLAEPILTPTTKSAAGHDEPVSAQQAAALVGGTATWDALARAALALFAQGTALAAERGLILVDTKYEFGSDAAAGQAVVLIDEVHTPDSSRYWYCDSYERDPANPRQLSKEFLRDWLRSVGFMGEGPVPTLPDAIRLEVAGRYMELWEALMGEPFAPLGQEPPQSRIWKNLQAAGILQGTVVGIVMGSTSDSPLAEKVEQALDRFGIAHQRWVLSAHKVPDKLHRLISHLNESVQPLAMITIAGRSNGLSGTTAANCIHPVIALPAFSDKADYMINIHSSLQMPSDTPAMTVVDPANAALAAARMLAVADPALRGRVRAQLEQVRAGFEG